MKATLHTDGGSRGNPGPAAIGFSLVLAEGGPVEFGEYIGETTNNQAEYQALVAGLKKAIELNVTELECFLDSELVVKQLKREYRVKDQSLRPHFEEIKNLSENFAEISFAHVRRELNKDADRLVNEALDNKK